MAGVKLLRFMVDIAATGFLRLYRLLATNYSFSSARMSPDPPVDLRFSGMALRKVYGNENQLTIFPRFRNSFFFILQRLWRYFEWSQWVFNLAFVSFALPSQCRMCMDYPDLKRIQNQFRLFGLGFGDVK